MPRNYKVTLWIVVKAKDGNAEGVMDMVLPAPPSVGLCIADVYSCGTLYMTDVTISPLTREYTVWASPVEEPDRKIMTVLKRFCGPWDWDIIQKDEEEAEEEAEEAPPESPKRERGLKDDDYRQAVLKLLRGRGTTLPGQSKVEDTAKPNPETN